MARAKYQVLVIPYYVEKEKIKYCVFHRSDDMDVWQFIAGGGEDEDTSELISAKREAYEEANIERSNKYSLLDTRGSIPTSCFKEASKIWGKECLVIPEYTFAVKLDKPEITISHEHMEYGWLEYDMAVKLLKYDSNKTALWELDNKIKLGIL